MLPGAGNSAATEPPKERQDEVILQLENELIELRNSCALKDQKISELSRTDTPASRLKRDIRQMASELHATRKQLSDSRTEVEELSERLSRLSEVADVTGADSPTASANGVSAAVRAGGSSASAAAGQRSKDEMRISDLTAENNALRENVLHLKAQASQALRPNGVATVGSVEGADGLQHARTQSGVATQRASEPPQLPHSTISGGAMPQGGYASGASAALRAPYLAGPGKENAAAAGQAAQSPTSAAGNQQDEVLRPIVYSSHNLENVATIGPTVLQGVGTADGVSSVAKVLLQRIHSSVCSVHRRQGGGMAGQAAHGQMVG